MTELAKQEFAPGDQEWVDRFLAGTTLFLGPDPEIMTDHRMAPRTADEERLLAGPIDANALEPGPQADRCGPRRGLRDDGADRGGTGREVG